MQYYNYDTHNSNLAVSCIKNGDSEESHLIITPQSNATFDQQLADAIKALNSYIAAKDLPANALIACRFFVSDCANQKGSIEDVAANLDSVHGGCAISMVQQPMLNHSKLAIWAYLVESESGFVKQKEGNLLSWTKGNYHHLLHGQMIHSSAGCNSALETEGIFNTLKTDLAHYDLNIKDHCIRTWIYVKDVDYNYQGVVEARRDLFEEVDLTKDTHFITSTGIEGRHKCHHTSVLMDAVSIGGIRQEQLKFLTAPEHLNPTHEYGVTFERGTSVDFGDRRHIYLSGTASIDNEGAVVYPLQIDKQIDRTILNVKALLSDADAEMDDVAQLIVYLRDMADAPTVEAYFDKNYKEIPKVIVLAPVCRPGWLIEMECIAIKAIDNNKFNNF